MRRSTSPCTSGGSIKGRRFVTPSRFSPKITPALSERLESLWHKQRMHAHRTKNVDGRATTRSKVSNGTRLFANTDGRSRSGRRFRDLVQSFEAEFDGDLSEADRSLIKQAATLLLKSEQMQEAVVRGEPVDSDARIRMASTARFPQYCLTRQLCSFACRNYCCNADFG
jgi:hypothetical protein